MNKCIHCGHEFSVPEKVYDNGHYDKVCPNCGSEDFEQLPKEPSEWIPCRFALPEKSGYYLCVTSSGAAVVLGFSANHQLWNCHDGGDTDTAIRCITHWMPLPPFPYQYHEDFDFSEDADFVNKALKEDKQ